MNVGFVGNRYKYANQCPCGKDNKDGKFAPSKGQEPDGNAKFGQCHSCGEMFFPPQENVNESISGTLTQKFIDRDIMNQSLLKTKNSSFFKWVASMFDEQVVYRTFMSLCVGTNKTGEAVFWMVDGNGRVCQPKCMAYGEDGHRTGNPLVPQEYRQDKGYYPQAFGGHIAFTNEDKVIGVVESEKTAVLASIVFPEVAWISGGGASGMSYDKVHPFRDRDILIFYDADQAGRDNSVRLTKLFQKDKCRVVECDPWEDRTDGYDLGDYISDFHFDEDKLNAIRSYIAEKCKKFSGED